jgi:lipopolysaccharide transport system ATP-binding protein
MARTVISVENVSKSYQIGIINTGTFRGDLQSWWARRRGKPDPFLKIGEENRDNIYGKTLWALNDINFQVRQGEALGIIGRNGAGKSTLLKILSRVTAPTSGELKVKGRIASLLEVGTGFHPELTGRENVFVNGAIMGMTRTEIKSKFDEIVDFSGVEHFIDTPVKRYSSGMYMRLAFAVAAHLDPDILVIDEVLAVGDAEFQKKSLGKMGEAAHQGRTVLFVSHNMGAVLQLCSRAILLKGGHVALESDPQTAVTTYMNEIQSGEGKAEFAEDPKKSVQILSMSIVSEEGEVLTATPHTAPLNIVLKYKIKKWNIGSYVCLDVFNEQDIRLLWSPDVNSVEDMMIDRTPGIYVAKITIPGGILAPGRFFFTGAIYAPGRSTPFDAQEKIISIEITDGGSLLSNFGIKPHSATMIPLSWKITPQGL